MPRRTGARRTRGQREYDQQKLITLWCQGTPIHEIANQLNVSNRTNFKDLAKLRKQWANDIRSNIDEFVAEQCRKIDHLEMLAYAAWFRSCETEESTRSTASDSPSGRHSKITKTEKPTSGDPRYLEKVQWCIEQRLKLVGAYAPEKHIDVTPPRLVDIKIESHEEFLDYQTFKDRLSGAN